MSASPDPAYASVERALRYLAARWEDQPTLAQVADAVGASPFHLQRVFTDWAGVSPKKFLAALTLDQARRRLEAGETVLSAALDSGLSGPGRLHDLFVTHEAMTPGQYRQRGAGMTIRWGWHDGLFGPTLVMVSGRGLCGLSFLDDRGRAACFNDMASRWPGAAMARDQEDTRPWMDRIFPASDHGGEPLRLFLRGTPFQLQVWQALLNLPAGGLTTYGKIAAQLGRGAGAARAVGSAVGGNPISWLIPCHRVIRATGALGGYRWGLPRKVAMLGWEGARAA